MNNKANRYTVPSDEDFEPDSNQQVLKNYLGIKSKQGIETIEAQELMRTALELLDIFDDNHRFTAEDICNIHEYWLGDIYPCAGKYRSVNMEKAGFPFASPLRIEKLMHEFEIKYLKQYTPCHIANTQDLAFALGIVHVELIIIHPFREGNGRTARLLADLMSMQANNPPLNFTPIDQSNPENFNRYIVAIHAGFNGDYSKIQKIFMELLIADKD
ncbi:MAG: hypothetical protein A3F10_05795 [Coxiella sp. RIFCSPHIGHO2_12_FULL_42_15]|nr:MAG: hypothetical protein A3F10_05795 [Coxiella sp. RIFCSPHIGHO2_12_FULL_42_15]